MGLKTGALYILYVTSTYITYLKFVNGDLSFQCPYREETFMRIAWAKLIASYRGKKVILKGWAGLLRRTMTWDETASMCDRLVGLAHEIISQATSVRGRLMELAYEVISHDRFPNLRNGSHFSQNF